MSSFIAATAVRAKRSKSQSERNRREKFQKREVEDSNGDDEGSLNVSSSSDLSGSETAADDDDVGLSDEGG